MNYQNKVKEFQLASGQPVSDVPYELTKDEYDFRDSLLREEIKELRDAIVDNNRVEILDALCDIKYVNDGTANMIGYNQYDDAYYISYGYHPFPTDKYAIESYFQDLDGFSFNDITESVDDINDAVIVLAKCFGFTLENFLTALDRVHLSNMSKFCIDTKTADKTRDFYLSQGIETILEPRNKVTVVYRKEDRKVLKSVEYHPVVLDDLI